eukprot:GHVU01211415.1.p2 GENE.GHVU01211415.1~~GHVU01211415.1.p2  ORF type:complete len:133 (+),score=11.02 GHVU01211415.1:1734-2132(+)
MRCRSGQEATVEAQRMKGSMSIPHSSVWHATNCTYQRSQCFDDDATFLHNIQCKNTTVIMSQRLDVNATIIHPSNMRTEARAQDGRGPAFAGKHCHPGSWWLRKSNVQQKPDRMGRLPSGPRQESVLVLRQG